LAAVGHLALFPDEVKAWARDAAAKERRELGGASASPPPATRLPARMPSPPPAPPTPAFVEECWGRWKWLSPDGRLLFWYAKDDDATEFFLEPTSLRTGPRRYLDGAGAWWCHETSRRWFRERNGAQIA